MTENKLYNLSIQNLRIGATEVSGYKKPWLYVMRGNEMIKVASFNSYDSAVYFMDSLSELCGINRQEIVKHDG